MENSFAMNYMECSLLFAGFRWRPRRSGAKDQAGFEVTGAEGEHLPDVGARYVHAVTLGERVLQEPAGAGRLKLVDSRTADVVGIKPH
jgi:hypothetical protein